MKKFLYRTTTFSLFLILIYFITSFITSNKQEAKNNFTASIIDKHKLIDSIQSPKMIFAGGSNVPFGINSLKIENEFNIRVVDLGLHGGLGLSFMLEELKYSAKSGDIVFLSIEYFLDLDGNYKLKKLTSSFYNDANKFYDNEIINDIDLHIENTRNNLKQFFLKSEKQASKLYSRNAFNRHGDVIAHLKMKQPTEINDRGVLKYRYWEGIKKLNEFNDYANSNNIKVFFLYPSYPISEYNLNKETIIKYANDLSNDLDMLIINKPIDFVYDDSLFFDTVYHLNKIGREMRTNKLVEIIKRTNAQQRFL